MSDCDALIWLDDLRITHMGIGVQHMAYVHSIALPLRSWGRC
jgi:hypothetical protein